jgi:NAD(P)-dependent dehydrogenase (short-subunit alcohol dehydrogenase family)
VTRLEGRHALITGAGSGLGRVIAERFAADGARVTLVGRREEVLREVAAALTATGAHAVAVAADVRQPADVARCVASAVEALGPIDVLVNNAGIVIEARFLDIELDSWDAILETNLRGPFLLSQAVARGMAERGGGVILNNASIDRHGGERWHAPYNASKAGLVAMTRTMAVELAEHGIRVNVVSPGYAEVEMVDDWASPDLGHHLRKEFDRVPLRRLVTGAEVAAAFAFLASDDASGITGHELVVDGGLTANLYIQETWRGIA